jgi:hypothetical protein
MGALGQIRQRRAVQQLVCLVFSGLVVLAMAGCATQKQVRDIVNQSNTQLMASQLADPEPATKPGAASVDAADKIEEFIAAHPDQKAINGSLRIRQAILYLNKDQYNLAEAAFDQADANQLFTDRDRALKNISPYLVWWFKNSRTDLTQAEAVNAKHALDALQAEVKMRSTSPGIRDYLAELRVWIGLAYAKAAASPQEAKARFEDAMNEYATVFSSADLADLCKPSSTDREPSMQDVKRRLRAEAVIEEARARATELRQAGTEPALKVPQFQALIDGSPACEKRAAISPRASTMRLALVWSLAGDAWC